jgi:RNA 2',3'-cyclic 3'-phosphodiesterase
LRRSPPASLHITLAFLGDLQGAQLIQLKAALRALLPLPAPLLWPQTIDPFRHAGGTILAVHMQVNSRLVTLQQAVLKAASQCRMTPRQETFRPHITLARRATKSHIPLPADIAISNCDLIVARYGLWKGVHERDNQGRQHYRYQPLAEFNPEAQ